MGNDQFLFHKESGQQRARFQGVKCGIWQQNQSMFSTVVTFVMAISPDLQAQPREEELLTNRKSDHS